MRLLRSAARSQPVDCFFCLSPSILPPLETANPDRKGKGKFAQVGTRWNWCCQRCGCWNIRDEHGDMVSDLPGMHNPSMNSRSFSLRASQSTSHLPSSSKSSPFCHNCLTNQTLIMNLLANYLPDDSDPTYPSLYANLTTYLNNLHQRYPPVCPACQPAVEEALRKSDHRAQAEALGSALQRGSTRAVTPETGWDVVIWRIRGGMWIVGTILSLGVGIMSLNGRCRNSVMDTLQLALNLVSILWIAWDPYWLRRVRGRAKVRGRQTWIRNMFLIYGIRIAGSMSLMAKLGDTRAIVLGRIILEFILLFHSFLNLKISEPVAIKLVRPVSLHLPSRPSTTPLSTLPSPESNPIPSMPISSNPNPIFGQASFHPRPQSKGAEPMDWEPLSPDWNTTAGDWDNFAVNKQRMFSPGQEETGLESLLAGWGLGGDERPADSAGKITKTSSNRRSTMLVLKLLIAALRTIGTAVMFWDLRFNDYLGVIDTPLSIAELVCSVLDPPRSEIKIGLGVVIAIRLAWISGWGGFDSVRVNAGIKGWWIFGVVCDLLSVYL